MAFRSAATTVVARLFQLLDSTGFVRFAFDRRVLPTFAAIPIDGYAIEYDTPEWTNANTRTGLISSGNPDATSIDLARTAIYSDINRALTRQYLAYLQSSAQYGPVPANDYAQAEMLAGARDSGPDPANGATATVIAFARQNSSTVLIRSTDGLFVDQLRVIGSTVWVNLPSPVAGWTAAGGTETPMFKTCDGRVYLRGRIENTSGVAKPWFSAIINPMPVAIRPLQNRAPIAVTNTGFLNRSPRCLLISPAGLLQLDALQTLAGDSIILDNTTWELD